MERIGEEDSNAATCENFVNIWLSISSLKIGAGRESNYLIMKKG